MNKKEVESVVIKKNVVVPMRDGIKLYADLYLPNEGAERKFPCLIQRTPYDKNEVYKKPFPPKLATSLGFAVLVQDTRGCFESEGEFKPYENDASDGYDTVEWAAEQSWCNGKIGMYGGSYVGATQLLASTRKPPHLITIFPTISSSLHFDGWAYHDGAFKLINLVGWTLVMIQHTAKKKNIILPDSLLDVLRGLDELHHISFSSQSDPQVVFEKTEEVERTMYKVLKTLPLNELQIPTEAGSFFFDRLEHYTNDEYWKKTDVSVYYGNIQIPMFHLGGWYDMFERHTIENYLGFSKGPGYQRLVMGPWSHGTFKRHIGEIDFGPDSEWTLKINELHRDWFDYWLKGFGNPMEDTPPIQIFVMGENRWRSEKEFPLARTKYEKWYFHSNGSANTLNGDGLLSREFPGDEPADTFEYDPMNPVPSKGGNILPLGMNPGPRDQRDVENRKDVLVYTSLPLTEDIEVTGPLFVKLWAATDAVETDYTAKLVDVHPDGYAQNIQSGIIRTSFRESHEQPSNIIPNEIYEYSINLNYTSNLFKKGHRIRIEISSSNFPHYSRNLNTGEVHHVAKNMMTAKQTIYHCNLQPSHIILPVIPR